MDAIDPTPGDLARDLAAELVNCRYPERIEFSARAGWFLEVARAACRRALAAEARLARLGLPTAGDRREELEEVLAHAADAEAGGYGTGLRAKEARAYLRATCLDWGPAACRRALAAEGRVRELEARADRVAPVLAALAAPPPDTRIIHGPAGAVLAIVFPGRAAGG